MDLSAADAEAAQQPITRKATFRPEHAYLLVALRFGAGGPGGDLDARVYKAVILAGVRSPKIPARHLSCEASPQAVFLKPRSQLDGSDWWQTRELYGDVGLRGEVDVLEVAADGSAIVRVPHAQLPELWSVLTLITAAEGKPCRSFSSLGPAREATQVQMDGFFSQLPCKCYLQEVAFVGD